MNRFLLHFCATFAFLGLIVAANWLTSTYGLIPIGLGLTATAGTWAAGLVLLARDAVQEAGGRGAVVAVIVVGAAGSAMVASPQLAVASAVAFSISETADFLVYNPLRRKGWARAALASGLVGSVVDTVLFLALAGFPIWVAMPGQMFAKTAATVAVVALVVVARAVLRHRVRPAGV